jgi:hypothetical protein
MWILVGLSNENEISQTVSREKDGKVNIYVHAEHTHAQLAATRERLKKIATVIRDKRGRLPLRALCGRRCCDIICTLHQALASDVNKPE